MHSYYEFWKLIIPTKTQKVAAGFSNCIRCKNLKRSVHIDLLRVQIYAERVPFEEISANCVAALSITHFACLNR